MPDSFTWEEATGTEMPDELSWEDVAPAPDLSGIKLSPYEQADIASMARGLGKARTGMEPGTELTEALAVGVPEAIQKGTEAIGKGILSVANLPTTLANIQRGVGPDMPGYVLPMEELPRPQLPTVQPGEVPATQPGLQTLAGIGNLLSQNYQAMLPPFAPPEVGLSLPLLAGHTPVARLGLGAFGASALSSLPQAVAEASKIAADPNAPLMEKISTVGQVPLTGAFGLGMLGGALRPKGLPNAAQKRIIEENRLAQYQQAQARGLPPEAGGSYRPVPSEAIQQAQVPQEGQAGVLLKPTVTETTPPVPPSEMPTGPTETGFRPAIRLVGGEVAVGDAGMTHPKIIDEYQLTPKEIDQRGFVDEQGRFYDREQVAQITGLPTRKEALRQHSTDLPEAQTLKSLAPKDTGELQVGEPPTPDKILRATPEQFSKWKTMAATYGPQQMRELGAQIKPAELSKYITERDTLRKEVADKLKSVEGGTLEERMQAAQDVGTKYTKAQTLNELIQNAPLSDLPEIKPGTVRLYHGEGGAEGAGFGGSHFSTDPQYSANFGPRQTYVDVPREVYTKAAEEAHLRGQPRDLLIGDEWVRQSQPIQKPLPMTSFDLDTLDIQLGQALESKAAGGFQGKSIGAERIWNRLEQQHGIKRGGVVEMFNDPASSTEAEVTYNRQGMPTGLRVNEARIYSEAKLDRLLEHEAGHWYDLENRDLAQRLQDQVSPAELQKISEQVNKLGYRPEEVAREQTARSIEALARSWRGRGWFDKLVGNIQRFASEAIGLKLTRKGAESAAVRAIAQTIKRISEKAPEAKNVSEAMDVWRRMQARRKAPAGTPELGLEPVKAGESVERVVDLTPPEEATRLKMSPIEIEWTQRGKEGAYRPISDAEAANPQALGKILTTDARIEGSKLPVSSSRRLVVMMDRGQYEGDPHAGEVHMVSVYPTSRAGAMAVNPAKAGTKRPNVPIADLLKRYKPLYSVLRDSPVKNFHQKFETLDDYMQRFGEEAGQRSQESIGEGALAAPAGTREGMVKPVWPEEFVETMEPTPAEEGALPAKYGKALRESIVPTDAELKAFHDFFEGEIPPTKHAFDRLIATGPVRATRQMAGAVYRAYLAEKRLNPKASPIENVESALEKLYDDLKAAETRTGFIQATQKRFRAGLAQAIQEGRLAPESAEAAPTGRELTLPRFARTRVPAGAIPPSVERAPAAPEAPIPAGPPWQREPMVPELPYEGLPRPTTPRRITEYGKPKALQPGTIYRTGIPPELARRAPDVGSFRSIASNVADELELTKKDVRGLVKSPPVKNRITAALDSADSRKNNIAKQAETRVRLASEGLPRTKIGRLASSAFGRAAVGNKKVLAAANVLVESMYDPQRAMWRQIAMRTGTNVGDFDPRAIEIFRNQIERGKVRAQEHLQSPNAKKRLLGRAEMRAYEQFKSELDYAEQHWNDPELQETARRLKEAYAAQYNELKKRGINVNKEPGFTPHRYDAAIWNPHSMLFNMATGVQKIIGERTLAPRSFDSYYHAFGNDAYLPITRDSASLLSHYMRKTGGLMYRDEWREGLKAMKTPDGQEVAADPKVVGSKHLPHKRGYEIVNDGYAGLSVHPDYARLVQQLVSPSHIEMMSTSRAALHLSQALKHSILVGDFFHLGRMIYYGMAVMGKRAGYRSGWSVLDIAERDMPEALAKGVIRQKDVDWANHRIPLGRGRSMSRRQIVEKFYSEMGANLGRVQDALYKELLTNLTPMSGPVRRGFVRVVDPSVGRYNRFLFDRLTRGMMSEAVAREFERQVKANPGVSPKALMRDIAKDVNNFFGNIGRQGWFKSKTAQDIARILFLAPQWVEGLIKKEAVAYGRLSGLSRALGIRQGPTALGTTGMAIGRSMAFMFALTQALNLIFRRQPTWMNEEEGHKFDAWIPGFGADEKGFWFSPMAIFNEVSHDLYRLANSKPTFADAVTQIIGNKEQPITRAVLVGLTGTTPLGQKTTTTPARLREMGKAVLPVPISFGRFGQLGLHAAAPSLVSPPPKGAVQRQAFATAGIKIEAAETAVQQTASLARDFMESEGLTKETGWQQIQTDLPGYTKLRSAIRNDDDRTAKKILEKLRETRTDKEIVDAMKMWKDRGFTGSKKNENEFKNSLNPAEWRLYDKAQEEKQIEYEKFLDWFANQP